MMAPVACQPQRLTPLVYGLSRYIDGIRRIRVRPRIQERMKRFGMAPEGRHGNRMGAVRIL